MAQAELEIGGRRYQLGCRDGEQAHLELLAGIVDAKARQAIQSLGGVNETRQLLLASLLLADELNEARAGMPAAGAAADPALLTLIERLEALAARVEKDATSA